MHQRLSRQNQQTCSVHGNKVLNISLKQNKAEYEKISTLVVLEWE